MFTYERCASFVGGYALHMLLQGNHLFFFFLFELTLSYESFRINLIFHYKEYDQATIKFHILE